jgi:hypothetical protein
VPLYIGLNEVELPWRSELRAPFCGFTDIMPLKAA